MRRLRRSDRLGAAVSSHHLFFLLGALALAGCQAPGSPGVDDPRPAGPVTFTRDIAPIMLEHCVSCHRPGQLAPFSLVTYEDIRKHGRTIAAVTARRVMPPWLPEPGYGDFSNQRRLRDHHIAAIQRWVAEGTLEGDPSDRPPIPEWTEGWQLGRPDLVIELPQPYTLRADGSDVFRNFVIPTPVASTRYVRGVEFRPGNAKAVHHATIFIDPTRSSRRLDEVDPEPGYDGMLADAVSSPFGHFVGWTPGKLPMMELQDRAWLLERGADLVVQLHLMPTGAVEVVQPSIGFFFTNTPPTRLPFLIKLGSKTIDIPAGKPDYLVTDSYVLPVGVEALSIYPHAHYLAKDIKTFATLPDGTTKWLIWIKAWNFNWQDVYRYAQPIALPPGTTITMEYTYDNSAENVRNPHNPPTRVRHGPLSSDEMGDLWLQVLPRSDGDIDILARDFIERERRADIAGYEHKIRIAPDAETHNLLAARYLDEGRVREAIAQLEGALRLEPRNADAHNNLGTALQLQGRLLEAIGHFRQALEVAPDDDRVHFNLGNALNANGQMNDAVRHFRQALSINPEFADALNNLGVALGSRGALDEAIGHFRQAITLNPAYADAHNNLGIALAARGQRDEALRHFQRALEIHPGHADAQDNLRLLLNPMSTQELR